MTALSNTGALRRSFSRIVVIIFFVVVWVGFRPFPTSAQSATDNSRFGLVNAYADPDAADASRAGWEIITLRWDELQPNSPSDWNPNPELDQWLATARQQGREVVAVVLGTPAWASNGDPVTGVPRGLYLPVSDPGNNWASFMKRLATDYGAKGISRFVVWKDPDIPASRQEATWDGSIEEYYQLVKVAYLATREANPNALTHLAGVGSYDPNWFNRFSDVMVDDPTAAANNYYFDVATLHIYYSPEQVFTLMQNHFFVMNNKGIPLKEVWINETNARIAIDPDAYPEGTRVTPHPNITLEQQASFIIQSYALAFAANRGARIGVYQLADDFETDDDQAFGLIRADGTPRLAYSAYQLAADQFNGFVFARRIAETRPLMDYVRLTFQNKVTHITWTLTRSNATLVIPARTTEATLIDVYGNRWTVEPEGGNYRIAVAGATCDDPQNGCLIGGTPWILVEDGIPDAANADAPPILVEEGGTPPTPDPSMALTATAQAVIPTEAPTAEPTQIVEATEPATQAPTEIAATQEPTAVAEVVNPEATTDPLAATPQPAQPDFSGLGPKGFNAVLPYLLMGLGALVIGAGGWYFFAGHRQLETLPERDNLALTQVNERIEFAGEPDESLFVTGVHEYPDLPEETAEVDESAPADPHSQATATHKRPELPEETAEVDERWHPVDPSEFYGDQVDDDELEVWDEDDYTESDEE